MPPTNEEVSQDIKSKKERACDACRRRKTKCDGSSMPNHVCSNCTQTRKPCTYVEASKPRGPPKAYITGLEDKLEALEALLQQICPDQDFSDALGPPVVRGSWKKQDGSMDAVSTSTRRESSIANSILPPLLIPYHNSKNDGSPVSRPSQSPRSTHLIFRSKLPSKRMRMRDNMDAGFSSSSEESSDEESSSSEQVEETIITSLVGREKITLFASENDDTTEDNNIRFHGRSSTAGLIETTRQFKHMHIRDIVTPHEDKSPTSIPDNLTVAQWRRPVFWQRPVWEYSHENHRIQSLDRLQTFLEYFPSSHLANTLIDLYFQKSNLVFPLLHRPTFTRQWKEKLHHHNIWFAGVCLSIFAVSSRWCDDALSSETPSGGDSKYEGRQFGRQYFDMAVEIHHIRQSLLHPTSLFAVQTLTLMGLYLRTTSDFPTAWTVISIGLRKAQDVGAHRKKVYRAEVNIDDELWKRAFWVLVVLDRIGAISLGRACGISEEDFDLDLPLEVDDDYWEAVHEQFKQPAGIPSTVAAFIQTIKLTQIMAFTSRTLYAINKSNIYHGITPIDQKLITKQLSSTMSEWLERLPEHLRWDDKIESPLFSAQSAFLNTTYHLTQILIWRPLIFTSHPPSKQTTSTDNDSLSIPALTDPAIFRCTEAARACARIVEVQLRNGIHQFYIPGIIDTAYVCGGLLLLNAWNLKVREKELFKMAMSDIKPPLASRIDQDIADAKLFLRALEEVRDHWDVVDVLLAELKESLIGLEIDSSGNKISYCIGKARSMTPIHDVEAKQYKLYGDRPPLKAADFYRQTPAAPLGNGSIESTIHSTSHSERRIHVHVPDVPHQLDSGMKSRSSITTPTSVVIDERPSVDSPAAANAWRGQGVPYISCMRRTSSSNLRGQIEMPLTEDDKPSSNNRILQPPESAVRYDNVNLHSDDRIYLTTPRYMHQGYHQQGYHGPSRSPYERPRHRADGWSNHLIRDVRSTVGEYMLQVPPADTRHPQGIVISPHEDRFPYGQDISK